MEANEVIRAVMTGSMSPGIARQELMVENYGDVQSARVRQKNRVGQRFIRRWLAFRDQKITETDMLMNLRDTVLTIGIFPLTPELRNLVVKEGEAFGLHLLPDEEVQAVLSRPGWFASDQFVAQCYGKGECAHSKPAVSKGDKDLFDFTGYTHYKSFGQKVAVRSAIDLPPGYTQLVTLPTGEGKSLVTQLSVATDNGLAVLVVPTTALGKDQYRAALAVLKKNFDPACVFDFCGDKTSELSNLLKRLDNQEIKLLITSPEALIKNQSLRSGLEKAAKNHYIHRLIIDEAHIVQDWGAHFRPDFQFMSIVRRDLMKLGNNHLKTTLLSATLTNDAVQYLQDLFSEKDEQGQPKWVEIRCDALRTEIRYMVDQIKDSNGEKAQQIQQKKVLKYVKLLPKPMLIYSIRPGDAENWYKLLRDNGIKNTALFTGLTEDTERTRIIKEWSEDKIDIVCATSAFGMGIDKPDVRTVIHVTMPENINRFYQEVGRGGRDGLPSLSLLCYCPSIDHHQQVNINHRKLMTWEKLRDRWFEMALAPEAERMQDMVVLDTRKRPAYFTEEEKRRSGNRNRDWNLHTVLFLVRHKFIEFVDMKYDIAEENYYVRVRMIDPVVMQDKELLNPLIKKARDKEYKASDDEFQVFMDMVNQRDDFCFAQRFLVLYPLASLECGGCPNHQDAYLQYQDLRLHEDVFSYPLPSLQTELDSVWDDLDVMIVEKSDVFRKEEAEEVALALNRRKVYCWIQPEEMWQKEVGVQFRGLILNRAEANVLKDRFVSLLGASVLISLGSKHSENQRLLQLGLELRKLGLHVAFHMSPALVCESAGKPIDQFVLCRICSLEDLQ